MEVINKSAFKGLSAEHLAEMVQQTSERVATYQPDTSVKPFSTLEYEVVDLKGRNGDFQKVKINLDGQNLFYNTKIKGEIDTDEKVKIQRYVATIDFKCTDGTEIKAGAAKWFAVQ